MAKKSRSKFGDVVLTTEELARKKTKHPSPEDKNKTEIERENRLPYYKQLLIRFPLEKKY
jgi:hypothetical protein